MTRDLGGSVADDERHLGDEDLADAAVDGPAGLGEDDRRHLAGCGRCAQEVTDLQDTLAWARSARLDETDAPVVPPGAWEDVAERLGLPSGTSRSGAADRSTGEGAAAPSPGQANPDARDRGVRRPRLLVLAAGVAVLAVVGIGALASTTGAPAADVVTLRPVAEQGAGAGEARLLGADADRRLDVQVSGLAPTPGYHEVWLLDPADGRVVSLGTLGSDGRADLDLPAGLDLSRYDVVDVSAEPLDGDPTHSGDSVLRGPLSDG